MFFMSLSKFDTLKSSSTTALNFQKKDAESVARDIYRDVSKTGDKDGDRHLSKKEISEVSMDYVKAVKEGYKKGEVKCKFQDKNERK